MCAFLFFFGFLLQDLKNKEKAERNARVQVAEAQHASVKDEIAKQVGGGAKRFAWAGSSFIPQQHSTTAVVVVALQAALRAALCCCCDALGPLFSVVGKVRC